MRVERELLVLACAASAGVHAALAPRHLTESVAEAAGFAAAALLLAGVAAWLLLRPAAAAPLLAGAGLLAALIVAYAATRRAEPIDAVGVGTNLIEAAGLVLAVRLARPTLKGPIVKTASTPRTLSLAALVALGAALAALAVSAGHAHAQPPVAPTARQAAFQTELRRLWTDHTVWTRDVIVSFAAGLPDFKVAVNRLLRNQADIGNAIKPFYGKAAGAKLTSLLRSHIAIAADVLAAAKAGDQAKLADAQKRWTENADEIAAFLTAANPKAWPAAGTQTMMREHLALTTKEAVARLTGRWGQDVAAYDAVYKQILHMADMLSAGIVAQFPQRFR